MSMSRGPPGAGLLPAVLFVGTSWLGKDLAALSPGLVLGGHFFRSRGMFGGQIMHLGAVGGQIVKFPLPRRSVADELPVAHANGRVAFVLPGQKIAIDCAVFKRR